MSRDRPEPPEARCGVCIGGIVLEAATNIPDAPTATETLTLEKPEAISLECCVPTRTNV